MYMNETIRDINIVLVLVLVLGLVLVLVLVLQSAIRLAISY